ncbi:MAG TPA: DUF1015 family protein [Micromonosporaceae bacterium]|nr:DUF1015 family protein [Micromonosporaceae bacterium]
MAVVHPISRAWISAGGTGARNYDEFADDGEITEIIAGNPQSALAIEMPHRAPESLGKTFTASLPDAVARLARLRDAGYLTPAQDVVALYRIGAPDRPDEAAYGVFAMVDTDQISSAAGEPGLVIRNEDVFIEKVRERVALAQATGHLLSPVLLLQTAAGEPLHAALRSAVESAGAPAVTDIDHAGRVHAVWALPADSPVANQIVELAGAGELVVADGNHRSLAAQTAGLRRFLAVITTPESVTIDPYHRLITELPMAVPDLLTALMTAGARVTETPEVGPPPGRGVVHLYAQDRTFRVELPIPAEESSSFVDRMDHSIVERLLIRDALQFDPGDKRIVYVGGDYPPEWLAGEVDAGRADLAILIAPVTVADFIQVNLAREKMPRKSTWFTPKARAGLVLAEIAAEG